METLAYLHLALAYEEQLNTDCTDAISTRERLKLFRGLGQQKLRISSAIHVFGLTVALGFAGMASKALAVVQQGDRGQEIAALQQRLAQLGYYQGKITGRFGSGTKEAVIQFQKNQGLTPDGIVGENTQTSLSESQKPVSNSESKQPSLPSKDFLRLGDRGNRIVKMQQRLAAAGFVGGENGVFDDTTEEAVRRFQQDRGLKVDGIIGLQTLTALSAFSKSNLERVPTKSRPWYEDNSAPLTPFTR